MLDLKNLITKKLIKNVYLLLMEAKVTLRIDLFQWGNLIVLIDLLNDKKWNLFHFYFLSA